MKILIATESYYPNISGVAVFTHNLAKKMSEKHEVSVIAPSPCFTEYEEVIDGVKVFRLASKENKFRNGYYVSRFPFSKVSCIIEKIKPDVIHVQDPVMISFSAMRKARKMNIPIIATNHFSLEYVISYVPFLKSISPVFNALLNSYLNWFYGKCNMLTCPTQVVANRFLNTKTKVEVVSNGVDLSRFIASYGDCTITRKKLKIPLKKQLVLYVGRIDVDKDLETFVKAIPLVLKKIDAHFAIVGHGTEREKLKEISKELKVDKNLTFVDFIPYENNLLPKVYQCASLFVNPCPHETQSLVVLEAEATGLPIVAARAGALPEIVKNGRNGYLFSPHNAGEMAKKIIKILSDKKLSKKMGEESLKLVLNHISDNTYRRYEAIYREIKQYRE